MQADNTIQFTDMMNTTLRFINSTSRHIFLTGKAGTGKTTFLRNLLLRTHKQSVIVAPTGIAALNAGGTTIHSQFLLPFGMFIPDRNYAEPPEDNANWYTESVLARRHPLNSVRKQVLRSIDLLIIDEVSMLRADLLDAIDYRLRSVRGLIDQPFGGIQLLLIGDLYQLPPVIKRAEAARLRQYYNTGWFFESKAIQRDGFTYIELDKIFRQKDATFINILNNLRANRPTHEDIAALNHFYKTPDELRDMRDVITLTTHNQMADAMNVEALKVLEGAPSFFSATIEHDYPESMYPVLARLELKVGAQIMFTRNDSESGAYYNGKLATVLSVTGDTIIVRMADNDQHYKLKKEIWENKKYTVNEETKELEEQIVGSFAQYPVRLAWAITVHKSQGLTFDKAIIDVGQAFADGQVYVALSRLRTLEGLILRTKVDPSIVSTDQQIVTFDAANNRPHLLVEEIKAQQRHYLLREAARTFDFQPVTHELSGIIRGKHSDTEINDDSFKPVLRQIADKLVAERSNTVRYHDQLKALLSTGKDDEFLDRIHKGAEYYKSMLWEQFKVLIHHVEEQRHQQRNKGYMSDLGDLDQMFTKKIQQCYKIIELCESIISGNDAPDFRSVESERARLRDQFAQEAVKASAHLASTSKKSKKSKRGKVNKGDTASTSVDMLLGGATPEQIAKERSLTIGTIENHLLTGLKSGRLQIEQLVDSTALAVITATIQTMDASITTMALHESLGGAYTFGTLRYVLAHMGIEISRQKPVDAPRPSE